MPLPLEKWQERLEVHFETLARSRAGSGFPIFALEHDLSNEQLNDISSLLRSRLKARLSLFPHWLLWVIYATERGYNYAGDEYWPSFEEHTPGWAFGDRYKVAPWFGKFRKTYDGVVPSGPWAAHFSIIAWPITHAILPRYLQRQFARTLYDLRFRLAGLKTVTPAVIGRLLAAHAHYASTRFQEFLQQEELTGRIVLALLGATPTEGKEPIYGPTLKRIVDDLEKVRSAREWLKETQRVVTDRFTGIGRGTGPPTLLERISRDARASQDAARLDIRPSLMLRHVGAATWSVILEVPSFRNVAALDADVHSFLRRTRCRLNGANDTKPAGWLLTENRKGILKSWPEPGKPLIQFEHSQGIIDHLLESECRLSSGPVWLFRISDDGTAREITAHMVRSGCSYIVVTKQELPEPHRCMTSCRVDCAGVRSFRIAVPPEVSAEAAAWLHRFAIQAARTVRVWPAGLPSRGWDGEGNSGWLTTEAPCFGIMHDHPVDAYVFCLDNRTETIIEPAAAGYPVFIRIEPLPVGTHLLTVKARRSSSLEAIATSRPAEGFVQLKVRDPEAWTPGIPSHPGLIVTFDPPDSDLDTFWRNEVNLLVLGPESHSVTISVSLEGRNGQQLLSEQVGGPIDLPVKPEGWRKRFAQFLDREECAWSYLEASIGTLTIKGDELGAFSARFEHDVAPLRWVLRQDHAKIVLRLVDDSGQEGRPTIFFFSMERPLKGESYHRPEDALSGIIVAPPGALFIVMHGDHHDSIVVSTGLTAGGFEGLSAKPSFGDLRNGSVSLADSLHALELWHDARRAGFLSGFRWQEITDGIVAAVYETLCGAEWARAEAAHRKNPNSRQSIDRLQRAVHTRAGFAAVLRRDHANVDRELVKALGWYKELAMRYGLSMDPTLCKFVLTLATQPYRIHRTFGSELVRLLNELSSKPAILRGARFLALLCQNQGRILPTSPSRWT